MTLDEAIKHCNEVVEKNEQAKKDDNLWIDTEYEDCCADHRQLAEWLTELKQLKAIIAGYGDLDMQKLEMVLAMIRIGSEDAWAKIEREKELKEAKRILKLAAKIVKNLPCDDDNCGECVHNDNGYVCSEYECFEWRYADEALALIGEDGDTNG